MALSLLVTLSAQAAERESAVAKQDKRAIVASEQAHTQDSEKGLLPRSMPAMARLEGVLYMARTPHKRIVKSTQGHRTAVTERTIQRVPKVHGS